MQISKHSQMHFIPTKLYNSFKDPLVKVASAAISHVDRPLKSEMEPILQIMMNFIMK